jgi:hypothetical protein
MQTQPKFDLADVTANARQFEDLLRCVEKFQKSRPAPSCNAARGEEALLDSEYGLDTAKQDE